MITLPETAVLLAAAVIAVALFRFARLSSILGYVTAGLIIGPYGLNLISDIGRIAQVSQFGIVLLLFVIGLELQPTRLWVMRQLVFGLGTAQVAVCALQFPQLRIFARARNRQHAFALMDAGVTAVIRETYASSLEMAVKEDEEKFRATTLAAAQQLEKLFQADRSATGTPDG